MSESASPSPRDRPEAPAPVPLDPRAGALPPALEWDAARPDTVLLLLDASGDRGWAADAAVALASGWARAGRRIVLADLHLEDPVLHERAGVPNLDGVVDVFLYGASLARTARAVPGRGFYLISAGTYTPDPEDVLRHPRWSKIVSGFADANATLLLFAPAGTPGLDALAESVGAAVVLGDAGRLPAGVRARAVVVPPGAPAAPEREVLREPEPDAARKDPLIGEYANGIPASTLPAAARRPPRQPDLSEPPPPEAPPRRRKRPAREERKVSPVLLVLLALVVLGAAGYWVLQASPGLMARMGLGGGEVAVAPTPAAVPAPAPAAAPTPAGVPLPYAVQVKAFPSLASARQYAGGEAARYPGIPFYVSLEWIDGVPYYKVLTGLLPDTVAAARLRDRLVESGVIDQADALEELSLIQYTPLAFDLGEFPTRPAAEARADSLLEREVPSYPVAVPYSAGPERWRLYGGAFRDSTAAEGMRRHLAEKGVQAGLVQRTGRPSQAGG